MKEYNERNKEGDAMGYSPQVKITVFKPEYDKYPGKIAPLKRNETIIENVDFILVFHDGISTGTLNALNHARRLKKSTLIIYF